jgi:hypothetical protein
MMDLLVIITLLSGSIGLMLFIVGSVFSAIVALGNEQKLYGWSIFLFLPVSLVYCYTNWAKVKYSGKMVFSGTFLLLFTAAILKVVGMI